MDIFEVGTRFRYKTHKQYEGVITEVERSNILNFYKFEYTDTSLPVIKTNQLLYTHSDLVNNWVIIKNVLLPDE